MVNSELEIHIIRALNEQNPWWIEGAISEKFAKRFRREDFYHIKNDIEKKEITAVIGQRQVGKTTILYQLAAYLINERNIQPQHILYFSFDNPYLGIAQSKSENLLSDILDSYAINILKKPFSKTEGTIYIFFDEITKCNNWSEILKGWYDLKHPLKFIISDSSSSTILKGSSESLVGRIRINKELSFKFIDFVRYKNQDTSLTKTLESINDDLRQSFIDLIIKEDEHATFSFLKKVYADISHIENELKTYCRTYMLKDGFPELIDMDIIDSRKKLYDYISLTLQKDLLRLFDIRNPKALENLITFIASESSQVFSYENIARNLSITDDTVREYLDYLESVFLVSRAQFYSKNRAKRIRKQDKIYLHNIGLRNVLVNRLNEQLFTDEQELGKVAEILVHDHAKRLFSLHATHPEAFYWKNKNGKEVDVILDIKNKPVAIEVKYKNTISSDDLKGINSFLTEKKTTFGIIITKDRLDQKENMILIPLWLFLLIC
jgi:uncharacterized protein